MHTFYLNSFSIFAIMILLNFRENCEILDHIWFSWWIYISTGGRDIDLEDSGLKEIEW